MTDRGRLTQEVRLALRKMGGQLGRLNGVVGDAVDLKGSDVELLDHLGWLGPVSPGVLARSMQIHPATLTGILDRLEAGGWVVREREPTDRRKVSLRVLRNRGPELVRLYAPMNNAIGRICASLTVDELQAIRDFLDAVGEAAEQARDDLSK